MEEWSGDGVFVADFPGDLVALATGQMNNLFVTYRMERKWWQFWKPPTWLETREFLPGELEAISRPAWT
jgi:hypothetical protein